MLRTLMKDYLGEQKDGPVYDFLPRVISESNDLPVVPEDGSWVSKLEPERLAKKFSFSDVSTRNLFVTEMLDYESSTGHHANILVSGLQVIVEVWTHDVDAVTELDGEYASHCDLVYDDISLIEAGYGGDNGY